ncbi:extensin-like [Homarus americanus]|uniref:extensin-like n=1 Tax=Homarus americanus TaxID=6706 RepID=UPI001C458589|nr:extensin-like [Homarus americanus]
MRTLILMCVVAAACAQYEKGHVKILQDKRYQDGATFGNFRDQEDGIKYFEETDAQGIRRGYWEYPSEGTQPHRVEFEAGPGIGFRILNSNIHAPTTQVQPQPQFQPQPQSAPHPIQPQPGPHPAQPRPGPRPAQPQPQFQPLPVHHITSSTPQPGPQNLFDYPGNLEFSRSSQGHRFKFTAT